MTSVVSSGGDARQIACSSTVIDLADGSGFGALPKWTRGTPMTDIYKWLFGPKGRAALTDPPSVLWDLPDELAGHRGAISATERPIVAMASVEAAPEKAQASQLGGLPWWPTGERYPTAADGHTPLHLLLQLNLADIPNIGLLPNVGLLQFFIAADETYGCDFTHDDRAPGFGCVYHHDLARKAAELDPHVRLGPEFSPLDTPLAARSLLFSTATMTVDPTDYRFPKLLPAIFEDPELLEAYALWHASVPLRLGGYPSFVQEDPRTEAKRNLGDVALLTLDTTDGIMWGDAGAAQFMMRASDLARLDFSNVTYNWDCS